MSMDDEELTALLEMLEDDPEIEVKHEVEANVEEEKQVDNNNDNLQLPISHEPASSKVNSPVKPIPILNARGMPIRKRKRNKYYSEEDDLDLDLDDKDFKRKRSRRLSTVKKHKAIRKPPKKLAPLPKQAQNYLVTKNVDSEAFKQILPNKAVGMNIGIRLRNILKLSKSLRWLYCEFFYSSIDKCFFSDDNDFEVGLKINYPRLPHMMTRIEWNIVRRKLGKRRRCSELFFLREREILESKREKIRQIQQLKAGQIHYVENLPSKIPMRFIIGTKVTARLRQPLNGLFEGILEAIDIRDNTYRISFERNLGTYSVPDYEVTSAKLPVIINNKNTHKIPGVKTEPLLRKNCAPIPQNILVNIILLEKNIGAKREQLLLLKTMNTEVEKRTAFGTPISDDLKRKHAQVLMNLKHINQQIKMNTTSVSVQDIAPENNYLKDKCKQEALGMVQMINNGKRIDDQNHVQVLDLVSDISYLMLMSKALSDPNQNTYKLQDLHDEIANAKKKHIDNAELYEIFSNCIEIHFIHILKQLSQGCKTYQIKNYKFYN